MSTTTRVGSYRCANDCKETGCPGHTMTVRIHHTSDTVTVDIDGQHHVAFDDNELCELITLYEAKAEAPASTAGRLCLCGHPLTEHSARIDKITENQWIECDACPCYNFEITGIA